MQTKQKNINYQLNYFTMKSQLKKLSLITGILVAGFLVSISFTTNAGSFEHANEIVIETVSLTLATPDGGDVVAPKCGAEGEAKKKTTESKCGEGKCGDDKKAEAKTTEASTTGVTSATTKSTDAGKCGEGKCGDDKSKEAKTGTAKTTSTKEAKTTSEGKCGEGKCGSN